VDAERGYSEDRWYNSDDRGYPEPDWRRGGYEDDRRPPTQRGYPEPSYAGSTGGYADPGYGTQREPAFDPGFDPRGAAPTSGEPRPGGGVYGGRPPMPPGPPEPAGRLTEQRSSRSAEEGVYRSRKPLHAALIGIFLGVFELIMLLQFIRGIFSFDLHRVLSGGLTLMALPAFGLGLYALLTGAAHGGPKAFLKAPLAYLPIGLILLVAAGAAA